jgi:hypothetical protein
MVFFGDSGPFLPQFLDGDVEKLNGEARGGDESAQTPGIHMV